MNYLERIWGMALAEMRSARRLARTWLFIVAGLALAYPAWMGMAFSHHYLGAYEPYLGMVTNVRYMFTAQIGGTMLLIFSIGIVFLAFDLRTRDRQSRMHEVLDTRPMDNFGFLLSRTLGITCIAALPILLTMGLAIVISFITQFTGTFRFNIPQPHAFWQFALIDLLPNLFFYTAYVVFLAMVLRYRILVILVGIGSIVALYWVQSVVPYQLMDVFLWTSAQEFPSDVEPVFTNLLTLLERVVLILLSFGLIYLGAMAHHRTDGPVALRRSMLGFGLVFAAVLGFYVVFLNSQLQAEARNSWYQAHQAIDAQTPYQVLDLQELNGTVQVKPGSNMQMHYELKGSVFAEQGSIGLLFSFNPDFEIESVELNDTAATEYSFVNGLLTIDPEKHYEHGANFSIHLTAQGSPTDLFEYLDSGIDLYGTTVFNASNLRILGSRNLIFDSDAVVLTPDAAWYPIPGPNVHRDQTTRRPRDFFALDLQVSVPDGWNIAGPGKESSSQDQSAGTFKLNPSIPVASITLLADEYYLVGHEIEGITFELLVHPKHSENIALFSDIAPQIETVIREHVQRAKQLGLQYPFNTLSLVEIPATLRVFGGGWRMDTIQSQPGVLYLKELTFPTVSFRQQTNFEERTQWSEEERKEYKLSLLQSYLKNDLHGGNIFLGFVRNLFSFQTGATGPGAEALDYLMETLVNRLIAEDDGFFSAYLAANPSSQQILMGSAMGAGFGDSFYGTPRVNSAQVRDIVFENNATWEASLEFPLKDLPFTTNPETALKVLELKGQKIAASIVNGLGEEPTAKILSKVLEEYGGKTYRHEDLHAVSQELNIPLEDIVGDWLNDVHLPGFTVSRSTVRRIQDDANGLPQYETSFHIRNTESTPGVLTVEYLIDESPKAKFHSTPALTLAGGSSIRVNLISMDLLTKLQLNPYFSLNRQPVAVFLPELGDERREFPSSEEPRPTYEPSDWIPADQMGIIVDDLDDGFSTDNPTADTMPDWMPQFIQSFIPQPDFDQGLPAAGYIYDARNWYRHYHPNSYGNYRRTTAKVSANFDAMNPNSAYFKTSLPKAGVWQLDYHLPMASYVPTRTENLKKAFVGKSYERETQETYEISLLYLDKEHKIEFDAAAVGHEGWNRLGEYELPAVPISVKVTNRSSGGVLYADAIRWIEKPS